MWFPSKRFVSLSLRNFNDEKHLLSSTDPKTWIMVSLANLTYCQNSRAKAVFTSKFLQSLVRRYTSYGDRHGLNHHQHLEKRLLQLKLILVNNCKDELSILTWAHPPGLPIKCLDGIQLFSKTCLKVLLLQPELGIHISHSIHDVVCRESVLKLRPYKNQRPIDVTTSIGYVAYAKHRALTFQNHLLKSKLIQWESK